MHVCYRKLRETVDGRAAIMSLMGDPNPQGKNGDIRRYSGNKEGAE
jgi:hypothetical protein